MRYIPRLASYVLLILSLLFTSCASKAEQTVAGKWQEVNGNEIIEFLKDGSFQGNMIWDMTKTPVIIIGTYSTAADIVTIRPTKPADLVPMTWQVKLSKSNKEITVTFQQGGAVKIDGSSSTYRRID